MVTIVSMTSRHNETFDRPNGCVDVFVPTIYLVEIKILFVGQWWWSSGQRVRLLFYCNDPSLNLAEVYSFYSEICLKRTKMNIKRPGMAHLKKYTFVMGM